jgi:hypothetical protein
MIISYFWISIIKDENWLLVFLNSAMNIFLATGSKRKTILGSREEKILSSLV